MLFLEVLANNGTRVAISGRNGKTTTINKRNKVKSSLDKKATNRLDRRTRVYKKTAGKRANGTYIKRGNTPAVNNARG